MTELAAHVGRSIRLYMVDGHYDGIVEGSISGWTGKVTKVPRHLVQQFAALDGADQAATYILIGGTDGTKAYVGETDDAAARLTKHIRNGDKKDVFDNAYVISSTDRSLNKSHVKVLEHEICMQASEAGRYEVTNEQGTSWAKLSDWQMADLNRFYEKVKLVLMTMRVDILEPTIRIPKKPEPGRPQPQLDDEFLTGAGTYQIPYRPGDAAGRYLKGIFLTDGRMLVLAGSRCSNHPNLGPVQERSRRDMIRSGLLAPDPLGGDFHVQTANIVYNRPASAAAILTGKMATKEKNWTHRSKRHLRNQILSGTPDTRDVDVSGFPTVEIPRAPYGSKE